MFSLILRRTHMYLALFLSPWVLIYTLSTLAMNHRDFFRHLYGGTPVVWEKEEEQTYAGVLAADARPRDVALQILSGLNLDGAFNVNAQAEGQRLVIVHQAPVTPRRITFTRADGKMVIERQLFRSSVFLERMHRRRGYQFDAKEDAWAFSVDLFIVAMVVWALTGLWMWWEMKATRVLGAVFAASGLAIFGLFLWRI